MATESAAIPLPSSAIPSGARGAEPRRIAQSHEPESVPLSNPARMGGDRGHPVTSNSKPTGAPPGAWSDGIPTLGSVTRLRV